jgi:23S rRNA (guanosine2251-2'-O)-methyltransferase
VARRRRNTEFIYGRNPVEETLRGRRTLHKLWVRQGARAGDRISALLEQARSCGLEIQETDARTLDRMSGDGNHQGIVLEAGAFSYVDIDELIARAEDRVILVLDHLQDPQNLATLIRTAAAVDVAGVIIQTDRSVAVTPAVVRSSAGLVERVPVARVANTRRAIQVIKDAGYWATALESGEGSTNLFTADVPEPVALVIGAEGSGVTQSALKVCDLHVHLPMPGDVESLNAAVAGSVALFELLRRRQIRATGEADASPDI